MSSAEDPIAVTDCTVQTARVAGTLENLVHMKLSGGRLFDVLSSGGPSNVELERREYHFALPVEMACGLGQLLLDEPQRGLTGA